MKKQRTAPLSPKGKRTLREAVLYAPKRWDQMDAQARRFVQDVHDVLASGYSFDLHVDSAGRWEVVWSSSDIADDDETPLRRKHTWWPPLAPGFVTRTLDGGQFRRKSPTGWWTFYVAAYSEREAYHLGGLGTWAPDAFTPGIRRMFHTSGAVVLQPER